MGWCDLVVITGVPNGLIMGRRLLCYTRHYTLINTTGKMKKATNKSNSGNTPGKGSIESQSDDTKLQNTDSSENNPNINSLKNRFSNLKRQRQSSKEENGRDLRYEQKIKKLNIGLLSNKVAKKSNDLHFAIKQEILEDKKLTKAKKQLEKLDNKEPLKSIVLSTKQTDRTAQFKYTLEEQDDGKQKKIDKNHDEESINYDELHRKKYYRMVNQLQKDNQTSKYDADPELTISGFVSEEKAKKVATIIQKEKEKSAKFSRRRIFDEDGEDVNYINEGNMRFNKKLERSFTDVSQKIKDNLERGTAL